MATTLFSLLLLAIVTSARTINPRASGPISHVKNGTVIGFTQDAVDCFLGIPFAQPPVGKLRLHNPTHVTKSWGTLLATSKPTACPQFTKQLNASAMPPPAIAAPGGAVVPPANPQGEDCLTLSVFRPSGTPLKAKLPVVLFIFAGGFETGSTQTLNETNLVAKSVSLETPIIFAEMNYRVAGFGFLPGKEVQAAGIANLGLKDQRLAMKWVAENIAAFGGDPDNITLWGVSAGSVSAMLHTVINGGDSSYNGKPLFRGAIMDSGNLLPGNNVNCDKAQDTYDTVTRAAGCSGASDTLECLRSLPYPAFKKAQANVPNQLGYSSLDLAYLPRPDPQDPFLAQSPLKSLMQGKFARVSMLMSSSEDEGTVFSLAQSNLSTTKDVVDYLSTWSVNTKRSMISTFVNTYPDDPSAGSPYGTGVLYELYPQYKRLSAILGDSGLIFARRLVLEIVSSKVSAWSHLSSFLDSFPFFGTFHTASAIVALNVDGGLGQIVTQNALQTRYISFIAHQDPNVLAKNSTLPLNNWPKWEKKNRTLLNYQALGLERFISDDFRAESYAKFKQFYPSFAL